MAHNRMKARSQVLQSRRLGYGYSWRLASNFVRVNRLTAAFHLRRIDRQLHPQGTLKCLTIRCFGFHFDFLRPLMYTVPTVRCKRLLGGARKLLVKLVFQVLAECQSIDDCICAIDG